MEKSEILKYNKCSKEKFMMLVYFLNAYYITVSISNNMLGDYCTIYVDKFENVKYKKLFKTKEKIIRNSFTFVEQLPSNYDKACETLIDLCKKNYNIDLKGE